MSARFGVGRPPSGRAGLANVLVAKTLIRLATTTVLTHQQRSLASSAVWLGAGRHPNNNEARPESQVCPRTAGR